MSIYTDTEGRVFEDIAAKQTWWHRTIPATQEAEAGSSPFKVRLSQLLRPSQNQKQNKKKTQKPKNPTRGVCVCAQMQLVQ